MHFRLRRCIVPVKILFPPDLARAPTAPASRPTARALPVRHGPLPSPVDGAGRQGRGGHWGRERDRSRPGPPLPRRWSASRRGRGPGRGRCRGCSSRAGRRPRGLRDGGGLRRRRGRRDHRARSTRTEETFGEIDLFFANAGVGIGTDLETPDDVWATAWAVNWQAHLFAAPPSAPGLAGPRRGLLLLDRLRRRTPGSDRLGSLLGHQACRGRLRGVAQHHLRGPRGSGLVPVPHGCEHQHADRRGPDRG